MCSLFNSDKLGKLDEINCEEPVLIMMSGGIGCATLLAYLKKRGFQTLKGVFFYYNSCISKEQECAEKLANYYNVDLEIVDILNVYRNMVIEYNRKFEKVDDFYIPYRNGVFISVATAFAYHLRYSNVVWGTSLSSLKYYSDCHPNFIKTQQSAVRFGTNGNVSLLMPLSELSKLDVWRIGKRLGIPAELTWSCASSNENQCGKCFGCLERSINAEILRTEDFQGAKVCTQ